MDMWPQLTGAKPVPRELYWRTGGESAVRVGHEKLIERGKGDRYELYNLADDPYEERDLAGEQPARVAELRERLRAEQAKD
jgi:hypothetical protein